MSSTRAALARTVALLFALALAPRAAGQSCPFERAKLLASDGEATDLFGVAVAISGSTALVGAHLDDDNGPDAGAAHSFDATTGLATAKLVASDGAAGDFFGYSVALAGALAVVGANGDDEVATDSGSAYLFDTATGQEIAKLVPGDGAAGDAFGVSVAIGSAVVVGAHRDEDNGTGSGSAYVFDTTGQEVAKLVPSDGAPDDEFGIAVAISGTTVLVGAHLDDDNGPDSGSAYLFDAATGQEIAKLLASDGAAGDRFGAAVAISGATAVVGASLDDDNGFDSGSVYVFDTATGLEIAKLVPGDGAPADFFGNSVAIAGTTALVGSHLDDAKGLLSGSAYLFDAATGLEIAKLVPADGQDTALFGQSVAISGPTALVGAFLDDEQGFDAGAAYVFVNPLPLALYCTAKPNSQGCATGIGWTGAPSATSPTPFDVTADPVINGRAGLLFYGTSGRDAIPFLGGIVCAAPTLKRTPLQFSFGNPPPAVDCSGTFAFDLNVWVQSGIDPVLVPGQPVNAQWWWRDPAQPDGTGVALTDAIELGLCL